MKPNTRIDNFLAKIAGDPDANTTMKPRSPEEYYLNQIAENGGGGGGGSGAFIVNEDAELALDKTWQEIYNALDGGNIVIIKSGDIAYRFVSSIASVHGSYMLSALGDEYGEITAYLYSAEGADAYPTLVTE